MNPKVMRVLVLGLGFLSLGFFAGNAFGQLHRFEVEFPQAFTVRQAELPPGKYIIDEVSPNMFTISNSPATIRVMFMTEPINVLEPAKKSHVTMNVYDGNLRFLSQLWREGDTWGRSVIKDEAEIKLMKEVQCKTEEITCVAVHK